MKKQYQCCRCNHIETRREISYSLRCDLPSAEFEWLVLLMRASVKCSQCGGICHPTEQTARKLGKYAGVGIGRLI